MTNPNLKRLRYLTEKILSDITAADFPEEAVNWADLRCSEAKMVVNDDGDEYFEVCVEEASPSADKLRRMVGFRLAAEGWNNVMVVTDW